MIHLTIPDTQVLVEADGVHKYDAFNIHINGAYHASIRYSQLLRLHEKLRDQFGMRLRVIDFPPKKLFKTLDKKSLNERRIALARYFQNIVQLPDIALHFITEHTFLTFQVRFADTIGLGNEYVEYFGLFLARYRSTSGNRLLTTSSEIDYPDLSCIRLLRNFESPYISLQLLNQKSAASGVFYRVVIRKLVWSARIEEGMFDDPGAVLLLYKQASLRPRFIFYSLFLLAVNDFHNSHLGVISADIQKRLQSLEEQGNCLQYIRLCHQLSGYSYEILDPCISDYPAADTLCNLRVGRRHIIIDYVNPSVENQRVESAFRATRIKMWRITEHQNEINNNRFLFQFEYLIAKDTFEWITFITNQAILLSLLLQSIGIEILKEHNSASFDSFDYERSNKNGSLLGIDSPRKSIDNDDSAEIEVSLNGNNNNAVNRYNENAHSMNKSTSNGNIDQMDVSLNANKMLSNAKDSISNQSASNSYESLTDLFNTISNELPAHENRVFNITDDDL